jgi:hypothetical protein
MASNPQPPGTPGPARQSPVIFRINLLGLQANVTPEVITYVLIGLAAAVAVVPVVMSIRMKSNAVSHPLFLWGCAVAVCLLSGGLFNVGYPQSGQVSEVERQRLVLMMVGGATGLATAILGIALALSRQFPYREQLAGGLETWRAHPAALIVPLVVLLAGLVMMFACLQLGRGMERSSQSVRRLVYGYNAVLSSLLLLLVLAIPNVLAYAKPFNSFFGQTYDATKLRVYTLSDSTKNFLRGLQEPVTVYVMLPSGAPWTQDVKTLLENCRAYTSKIDAEIVPVNERAAGPRLLQLVQKYKLADATGLLVVVGGEAKGTSEFIKQSDLVTERTLRRGESYTFNGESVLINTIKFLTEGKVVVYFTQGSGEPSLNAPPRFRGMPMPREPGLSELNRRLKERKNFEVKELRFGLTTKSVPADADVVVIVRPREMPANAVNALRAYLRRKKGKVMVLADPVVRIVNRKKELVPTGLEGLLAAHNVKLGMNHVLNLRSTNPLRVQAVTNPDSSNPVARAFFPGGQLYTVFAFENARTVDPAGAAGGKYAAETLLMVPPAMLAWAADVDADPSTLVERYARTRAGLKEFQKVWTGRPLSIAVTVSESAGGMPRDRAHAGLFKERPRLVVFGNASWITDDQEGLRGRGAQSNFDLFSSSLSWLRERADVGGSADTNKTRQVYDANKLEGMVGRLSVMTTLLLLLAVFGLGCGVWVVRRR